MGILTYTGNEICHLTQLSSFLMHVRKTGHPISFEDFSILNLSNSQFDVILQESLLIAEINPSLNAD